MHFIIEQIYFLLHILENLSLLYSRIEWAQMPIVSLFFFICNGKQTNTKQHHYKTGPHITVTVNALTLQMYTETFKTCY